ncbi:MAG: hypothetical protein WB422_10610 [Pseudolabrys sp.]|jgi:hypothetical protein
MFVKLAASGPKITERPHMRFRSRIAGFALLAFLHPAAQDIRIDAVMTAKADHFGGT